MELMLINEECKVLYSLLGVVVFDGGYDKLVKLAKTKEEKIQREEFIAENKTLLLQVWERLSVVDCD